MDLENKSRASVSILRTGMGAGAAARARRRRLVYQPRVRVYAGSPAPAPAPRCQQVGGQRRGVSLRPAKLNPNFKVEGCSSSSFFLSALLPPPLSSPPRSLPLGSGRKSSPSNVYCSGLTKIARRGGGCCFEEKSTKCEEKKQLRGATVASGETAEQTF